MRDDFVGKHRSISDLKVHLVLTTKYRRKVFDGKMIERLHNIYVDLLTKWDCKLIEFNGEEDHGHILFQYFPDIALNKLVNNLKSVSSRRIRQEYGEKLDAIYKKDVLWNGSYFVASCGGVTVTTLRKYIEEQDKPAWPMGLLGSSSSAYRLLAVPLYLVGAGILNSKAVLSTPPEAGRCEAPAV